SVLGMRFGEHGERTRFVLELSAPVPFDIFAVDQPDRLVIDFRNLIWPFDAADNSGAGLILRQRHGPSDIGTLRVVLELRQPARVADAFILPAEPGQRPRFVLDLLPADPAAFAAQVLAPIEPPSAGATATAGVPPPIVVPLPPAKPRPPVIRTIAI